MSAMATNEQIIVTEVKRLRIENNDLRTRIESLEKENDTIHKQNEILRDGIKCAIKNHKYDVRVGLEEALKQADSIKDSE